MLLILFVFYNEVAKRYAIFFNHQEARTLGSFEVVQAKILH